MTEKIPPQPQPFLARFQWPILLVIGLLIALALAYLLLNEPETVSITINPPLPTTTHTPAPTAEPSPTPAPLEIYITGAVAQPESRLSLPIGARVEDALEAAGGALVEADLSRVNLAGLLRDGDHVHVPFQSDQSDAVSADEPLALPSPNVPRLINVNTANAAELESLPGIGPALAATIIEYREANGLFATVDDLDNVSGIGAATLERLRPLISVGD